MTPTATEQKYYELSTLVWEFLQYGPCEPCEFEHVGDVPCIDKTFREAAIAIIGDGT